MPSMSLNPCLAWLILPLTVSPSAWSPISRPAFGIEGRSFPGPLKEHPCHTPTRPDYIDATATRSRAPGGMSGTTNASLPLPHISTTDTRIPSCSPPIRAARQPWQRLPHAAAHAVALNITTLAAAIRVVTTSAIDILVVTSSPTSRDVPVPEHGPSRAHARIDYGAGARGASPPPPHRVSRHSRQVARHMVTYYHHTHTDSAHPHLSIRAQSGSHPLMAGHITCLHCHRK